MVRRAVKLFIGARVERTIEKTIQMYIHVSRISIEDYLQMLARSPIVFAVEICFALVEI